MREQDYQAMRERQYGGRAVGNWNWQARKRAEESDYKFPIPLVSMWSLIEDYYLRGRRRRNHPPPLVVKNARIPQG